MLTLKVVEEVKRLLDEKCHSQRRIAQILHVSRGTVQAIASGKRGIHGRETDEQTELGEPTSVRCPGCGARVYLPCVLCKARAYRNRKLSKSSPFRRPRRVA
jgi:transcriptional regulator with XRE-family HTH domain